MELYLTVKTDIDDLTIDFIEVRLKSGKQVSLNWDYSWADRRNGSIQYHCIGICFNEKNASGKLSRLKGMRVTDVGRYSDRYGEGSFSLSIEKMEFYEGGKSLIFENAYHFTQRIPADSIRETLYDKFLASSWR